MCTKVLILKKIISTYFIICEWTTFLYHHQSFLMLLWFLPHPKHVCFSSEQSGWNWKLEARVKFWPQALKVANYESVTSREVGGEDGWGVEGGRWRGIISTGFFCSWPEAQEWVLIKHRSAAFHCCNILFNIDEMMKSQLLSIIIDPNQ